MDFYIYRILLPALPIDFFLTIGLFYLLKNSVSFKRKRRVGTVLLKSEGLQSSGY
jgi:hypothetical protein